MQNIYKKQILPDVNLTSVKTDKFKTGYFSVMLLTPLSKKTASLNALLPSVLRRGTLRHPSMESIARALDELYGAQIEVQVRKKGEYQCIGFCAGFADDDFLPPGENVLEKVAGLVGEILLTPNTSGGRLRGDFVNGEKERLLDELKAAINDKRQYSVNRMLELMCQGESYGVYKLGDPDSMKKITAAALTKHYKQLLATAKIEIFYCGAAENDRVENAFLEAFSALPRMGAEPLPETEVLLAPKKASVRTVHEAFDVTQGKLAIGFRLGDAMKAPNYAAITVTNALFGGAVTSKLFMNVREKLSLCYFASSMMDKMKGIMVVSSGIEFSKYDEALSEIMAQLQAVKDGDIEPWELEGAKQAVINSLRMTMDSQRGLETFYFDYGLLGVPYGPEDMAALASCVTKEEVMAVAAGIEPDLIYFLTGERSGDQ